MEKAIIIIRGGVAEVAEKSDNVVVELRDYDIDGANDDRLTEDDNGDLYVCSTY